MSETKLDRLPDVMTIEEVATYLRLDRRTVVARLIRPGLLRAANVGGRWRITRQAVADYLNRADTDKKEGSRDASSV